MLLPHVYPSVTAQIHGRARRQGTVKHIIGAAEPLLVRQLRMARPTQIAGRRDLPDDVIAIDPETDD
jgi:hypothetical protein